MFVNIFELLKVMKSKTKPLLLQNYVQGSNPEEMVESSVMLLKAGDDMRQDYAVLQVFEMMNFIWAKYEVSYHGNLVQAKTCTPTSRVTKFSHLSYAETKSFPLVLTPASLGSYQIARYPSIHLPDR